MAIMAPPALRSQNIVVAAGAGDVPPIVAELARTQAELFRYFSKTAGGLVERAILAEARGQFAGAVSLVVQAILEVEGNPILASTLLVYQGSLLRKHDDINGALGVFRQAHERFGNPDAWFFEGKTLLDLDCAVEAKECFEMVCGLDDGGGCGIAARANILIMDGRAEEALSFIEKSPKEVVFYDEVLEVKADALRSLGRFGDAVPVLEELVAMRFDEVNTVNQLSHCLNLSGSYGEALRWADISLARNAGNIDGRAEKAIALLGLGKFGEWSQLIHKTIREGGEGNLERVCIILSGFADHLRIVEEWGKIDAIRKVLERYGKSMTLNMRNGRRTLVGPSREELQRTASTAPRADTKRRPGTALKIAARERELGAVVEKLEELEKQKKAVEGHIGELDERVRSSLGALVQHGIDSVEDAEYTFGAAQVKVRSLAERKALLERNLEVCENVVRRYLGGLSEELRSRFAQNEEALIGHIRGTVQKGGQRDKLLEGVGGREKLRREIARCELELASSIEIVRLLEPFMQVVKERDGYVGRRSSLEREIEGEEAKATALEEKITKLRRNGKSER